MTLYLVFCFNQKHLCLIIVIKQMNANWKMETFLHVSRDLNLRAAHQLDNRPSYEEVHNSMRTARMLANSLSPILTVIFVLIWPSLLLLEGVFDLASFKRWVSIWTFLFCLFLTITSLVNVSFRKNRKPTGLDNHMSAIALRCTLCCVSYLRFKFFCCLNPSQRLFWLLLPLLWFDILIKIDS